MSDPNLVENGFLSQITAIIEQNIANEQFGVTELADATNMSRSNLLRKVKNLSNLSVSQFIRQVRLNHAMEMLKKDTLNVSEVSLQVGFGSTSYFIKCFREYYGYPPGEVGKRDPSEPVVIPVPRSGQNRKYFILGAVVVLLVLAVAFLFSNNIPPLEKSIAVLPFRNDSSDSSNFYLINGLMESTLNNLQKIEDLKVISRTSAEKYRNSAKSIPEMAKELNVNYFVEGSGQKIGQQILLNVQLIKASSDSHLWSRQYRREVKDIFGLQREIAKDIADEIQAVITQEEKKRIEKNPTDDLVAYDYFLKGRELLNAGGKRNLEEAIANFKKAVDQDHEFAMAYGYAVLTYYYLDVYQKEQKYGEAIDTTADKALLYDPKLGESLVAKAISYIHKKEYTSAVPYLEKALEYNPNSVLVISFLADFYNGYIPNTTQYLKYALKGIRLDIASQDSITASYTYLRLSNALVQTGFVDEALKYINKSLLLNPNNFYSSYVKVWLLFAKNKDCKQTKEQLIKELNKDTTRVDIIQDVGKVCYMMRDYKEAYKYYKRFIDIVEKRQLDIYKFEHLKLAMVCAQMGLKEKSEEFIKSYKEQADNDRSIYKNIQLSAYYAYTGDPKKAIEHLQLFSKEDNYQYWVLLYELEPCVDRVKDLPEFKAAAKEIENKFWRNHEKIRGTLEEQGLL